MAIKRSLKNATDEELIFRLKLYNVYEDQEAYLEAAKRYTYLIEAMADPAVIEELAAEFEVVRLDKDTVPSQNTTVAAVNKLFEAGEDTKAWDLQDELNKLWSPHLKAHHEGRISCGELLEVLLITTV